MTRRLQIWCDECHKPLPLVEVQWSGCRDNGYRLFDFCGYPCAERFRARMISEREVGA